MSRLLEDRDRWRGKARGHERRAEQLESDNRELRAQVHAAQPHLPATTSRVEQLFRPGHFYSPIPDLNDVAARERQIFDLARMNVPGVDLRVDDQLALLPILAGFCAEQPFGEHPKVGMRYGFDNDYFSYGDGLVLYAMLRHHRPARVVEVGSGWSSALLLDVNEQFFEGGMNLTFIEPYPTRLNELLRPADRERAEILEQRLDEVPTEVFARLAPGDLLFIDSTHVSRIGSDVNRLFLDIVPELPAGVHIHIHDMFWPFEYPAEWVYAGRAWNEAYLLRALLIGNPKLEITWFAHYLQCHHANEVRTAMPLWGRNPGGSLYLRTG